LVHFIFSKLAKLLSFLFLFEEEKRKTGASGFLSPNCHVLEAFYEVTKSTHMDKKKKRRNEEKIEKN